MPTVRKLEPEEVKAYQDKGKGTRKLTEELYDSILADYDIGDFGEAILDEGENRLTVRNRLKAAAARRGLGINFRRTQGDLIRFQIVDASNDPTIDGVTPAPVFQEAPAISSEAPPKRKGGRPKKQDKTPLLEKVESALQHATHDALETMGLREPVKRKSGRPKKSPAV